MTKPDDTHGRPHLAIVGNGRLGGSLARTLDLTEPFGHGFDGLRPDGSRYQAVLLCVPDQEIAAAAAAVLPGPLVGHCSGAIGLDVLAPHEAFSLHPLMSVTAEGAEFTGAGAAIDATTDRGLAYARALASQLGLEAFRVAEADRAAYHAAASIASNFLVTIEAAAEQLAASAGVERRLLAPLVRATVDNWAAQGPERALTGPVARGDFETVARQRDAIAQRAPDLLALFDALVDATAALAGKLEHA